MDRPETHDARVRRPAIAAGVPHPRRRPARRVVAALLVLGLSSGGCAEATRDLRASMQGARHYAAGSEALDRGDATTALHELREAARLVPHASEIQNHLGIAYWREGDLALARAAFETALELDCENEAARRNLDRLDAHRSKASRAIGHDG